MGCPFPPKIALSHGGFGPPSNIWFLEPTRARNPNGISIGSAVFAGFTSVTDKRTDRQTDRATRSVTVGRIYVCSSTTMRPNNNHYNIINDDDVCVSVVSSDESQSVIIAVHCVPKGRHQTDGG